MRKTELDHVFNLLSTFLCVRASGECCSVTVIMANSEASPTVGSLRKVCPHCSTVVHARRVLCGCGHAFPSKRKFKSIAEMMPVKGAKLTHERLRKAKDICRGFALQCFH